MSTEVDVAGMEDDVVVGVADALREELLGAVSCESGKEPSSSGVIYCHQAAHISKVSKQQTCRKSEECMKSHDFLPSWISSLNSILAAAARMNNEAGCVL
jgi:hypothetical protein